jgi:predicted TIM-barrel fold metal-dependent hydrolase
MRDVMVIDCDMHVIEPADLFSKTGLPIEGAGWNGLVIDGRLKLPDAPGEWPTRDDAYDGGPAAVYAEARRLNFGPEAAMLAKEREGIGLALMLPTRAACLLGVESVDPKLIAAACSIYNEWISDYCSRGTDLLPAGVVPLLDPHHHSVRVAEYAIKSCGARALVVRPNPMQGRTLDHPVYDDLYACAAEHDVPLVFHEGTGARLPTLGLDRAKSYLEAHAMSHPFEQMAAVLHCTVGGVFHRHPTLRIGFFEAGAGWLPWWLDRLDDHALGLFGANEYPLPARPSRYFRRQGFVTMDPGEDLVSLRGSALLDCVTFASDWPHGDSLFPHAVRTARSGAGAAWPQIARANAVRFLGLDGGSYA